MKKGKRRNDKKCSETRCERKKGVQPASGRKKARQKKSSSNLLTGPMVLPLKDQHMLLSHLQCILEEMCERFGAKHRQCRPLLEEHGWTEPKSLELHSWCRVILDRSDKLSPVLAAMCDEERKDILKTCANIRHSAVHRLPQDAEAILRSLEAGIGLAKMHQDTAVVEHIQNLQMEFQAIINDACSRQRVLQDKLQIQLEQISTEQARLKQRATEDANTKIASYFREAGARLADRVYATSHKVASTAEVISEKDSFSEPDIDEVLLEAEKAALLLP